MGPARVRRRAARRWSRSARRSSGSLAQIAAPTTILTGAEDRIVPPAAPRALAEQIPGAQLVVARPGRAPAPAAARAARGRGDRGGAARPGQPSKLGAMLRRPHRARSRWRPGARVGGRRCAAALTAPRLAARSWSAVATRPRSRRRSPRPRAPRRASIVSIRASTVAGAWVGREVGAVRGSGRLTAVRRTSGCRARTSGRPRRASAAPPTAQGGQGDLSQDFKVAVVYTGSGAETITYTAAYRSVCTGGGGRRPAERHGHIRCRGRVRYVVDLDRLSGACEYSQAALHRAHGDLRRRSGSSAERHREGQPHLRRHRLLRRADDGLTCTALSGLSGPRAPTAGCRSIPGAGHRGRRPDAGSSSIGQVRRRLLHARPVAVGQRRDHRAGRQARSGRRPPARQPLRAGSRSPGRQARRWPAEDLLASPCQGIGAGVHATRCSWNGHGPAAAQRPPAEQRSYRSLRLRAPWHT